MSSALSSKFRVSRIFSALFMCIFLVAGQVNAAGLFCRSDPLVFLSNGVIIDFSASMQTYPWNVQEVHYELHAPVGVSVLASIEIPTWIGSDESLTYYADQPAGQYTVKVIVETSGNNVAVNLDAIMLANHRITTYSVSGVEDQMLTLVFHS